MLLNVFLVDQRVITTLEEARTAPCMLYAMNVCWKIKQEAKCLAVES